MKMCREPGVSCYSSFCISLAHKHNSSFTWASFSAILSCFPWTLSCCLMLLITIQYKFFYAMYVCALRIETRCLFCTWKVSRFWVHCFSRRLSDLTYNGASILLVIVMPMWGLLWLQRRQKSLHVIYDQLKIFIYHH